MQKHVWYALGRESQHGWRGIKKEEVDTRLQDNREQIRAFEATVRMLDFK